MSRSAEHGIDDDIEDQMTGFTGSRKQHNRGGLKTSQRARGIMALLQAPRTSHTKMRIEDREFDHPFSADEDATASEPIPSRAMISPAPTDLAQIKSCGLDRGGKVRGVLDRSKYNHILSHIADDLVCVRSFCFLIIFFASYSRSALLINVLNQLAISSTTSSELASFELRPSRASNNQV